MTYRKWHELYQAYKMNFDLENQIKYAQKTYEELERKYTIDDVIP